MRRDFNLLIIIADSPSVYIYIDQHAGNGDDLLIDESKKAINEIKKELRVRQGKRTVFVRQ